ncbi:hypothetical protein IG631_10611 [Alternaria alternata]|nr:hypothetical protein IG631_10611 [Alternaria alternata]
MEVKNTHPLREHNRNIRTSHLSTMRILRGSFPRQLQIPSDISNLRHPRMLYGLTVQHDSPPKVLKHWPELVQIPREKCARY